MATTAKTSTKKARKPVPRGRKMSKQEARDYVFKTHARAMALLAKH